MPGFHNPESENPHSGEKAHAGKSLVEAGSPPRDHNTSSLPFNKFREIDANHDGKINFEELSNYIENIPARNFGPNASELAARDAYVSLYRAAHPLSLETNINKMTLREDQTAGLISYLPNYRSSLVSAMDPDFADDSLVRTNEPTTNFDSISHHSKKMTFANFDQAYKQHEIFECQSRASWLIKKANANPREDAQHVNREHRGIDKNGTIDMGQFLSIYGESDLQQ